MKIKLLDCAYEVRRLQSQLRFTELKILSCSSLYFALLVLSLLKVLNGILFIIGSFALASYLLYQALHIPFYTDQISALNRPEVIVNVVEELDDVIVVRINGFKKYFKRLNNKSDNSTLFLNFRLKEAKYE